MMTQIILLSIVLVLSGIVHTLDPYSFVNLFPLIVPYKLELIFMAAIFEFLSAVAIYIRKIRFFTLTLVLVYYCILFLMVAPSRYHPGPFPNSINALILILLIVWTYRLRKNN